MSLTRVSYHQRSLYMTPTGQNRAVKRLYIRHLAGKRTVPKGGCLRGPVGAYRGGELALGWCWPRRSARLWSGGAQLCLDRGAGRGFVPTSAAAEPCLPSLALLAFGCVLGRGLFLRQPSRAFEGVSQDPFHLTVGLRISSSAQRWTASQIAGSIRSGYCLRAMTCLLVECAILHPSQITHWCWG